jgi:hypothetical protein
MVQAEYHKFIDAFSSCFNSSVLDLPHVFRAFFPFCDIHSRLVNSVAIILSCRDTDFCTLTTPIRDA